ncbi:hypothetical protein [Exiguobacterium oxidotolerans]|uniref:Uncharacterized protein n=1 Tax=Exiguobacterium oxidotolerans TaxID=223958 RepID=A0A653IER8_9BACL|nr:hypothetical protein [Exiguobacterium oxidotolerans]VWX37571.1 conserved hypothetical protein [Exiguobacterium oxidotolerans]
MEFTHWKRRLQDHFERMGFNLRIERLAMQDIIKLEATHGAFLFFPVTINLYERMGWKMIAIESHHPDTVEDAFAEAQIESLFQLTMVTFEEEEREFLLGFYSNTGRYLTDRQSPTGQLLAAIEREWYDGETIRIETFEEFPGLFVAPPFAHQAYAFAAAEGKWHMFVGRTGRPANDYRFDGAVLMPHRIADNELFTMTPLAVAIDDTAGLRDQLREERSEIKRFHTQAMETIRDYDPSFGFAWRGTVTFFHGIPVDPFAQRLWLEDGQKRFRIMQKASQRILALGDTCTEAIHALDEAVSAGEPDGTPVSAVGQLILGIWQQFESDERTYLTEVVCKGISRTQAENRIRHGLARQEAVNWIERAQNGRDHFQFAGLSITLPHRPPGTIEIRREEEQR